ncbi:hypothetical protein [Metabacillus bambusae]|uniref:Uncharacterized protein n=1 Tax=Metabacillus bambusae TaxID=2795218 RepID=A0ABS3N4N2_9BACI|nr:hypothetical protein [Metabacillus bambusae]MBO1513240.1 hypothetical protein [Metabacillus bambusae]
MKSTKYQLLKGDFDHVCEQLKIHKKIIEELREENERFKRMYENTGAIFNRQLMKDKIERYEKGINEVRKYIDDHSGTCDEPRRMTMDENFEIFMKLSRLLNP